MKVKSVRDASQDPITFPEIKEWYETHLAPDAIDFDDPKPYEVYSEGRWAGVFQCVQEFELITLFDGSTKPIKDIVVGDRVLSYGTNNTSVVTRVFDQGTRDCVKITFMDGGTLTCTPDHPVLVNGFGWVHASKLIMTHVCLSVNSKRIIAKLPEPAGMHHVYDLEVDDEAHCFYAANVLVHNCTSQGAQRFFIKGKPQSIVDIAALTSIYRPGPLASDVDKLWLKHQAEPFDWGHPLINDTLKDTRGLLVFQEGVMSLANKVAGFPLDQTDEVRRAIMKRCISSGEESKKKALELEDSFVKGAMTNGVPEETAKKAYHTLLVMSGYAFNKSLAYNEEVYTYDKDGNVLESKTVSEVQPNDVLLSRDEETGEDVLVRVKDRHDHGVLELVEVELTSGEKVRCTMDHKFRTMETKEMLPLREILKRGLSIVAQSSSTCVQDVES